MPPSSSLSTMAGTPPACRAPSAMRASNSAVKLATTTQAVSCESGLPRDSGNCAPVSSSTKSTSQSAHRVNPSPYSAPQRGQNRAALLGLSNVSGRNLRPECLRCQP